MFDSFGKLKIVSEQLTQMVRNIMFRVILKRDYVRRHVHRVQFQSGSNLKKIIIGYTENGSKND